MSDQIKVPRPKNPLPEPVLKIMREVARFQYRELVKAGWCITCYRQPAGETTRCEECRARHDELQEKRNRVAGNKPWRAGGRGRKPRSAHIKVAMVGATDLADEDHDHAPDTGADLQPRT